MREATLVLLFKGDPPVEVLLGYKKVGFGHGKYTGFGGKVEPGESILETAVRELAEETGIHMQSQFLEHAATLKFTFPHRIEWTQRVHVYTAYLGCEHPHESREMIPKWFPFKAVPYDQMWDDGRFWLPHILAGRSFTAHFTFESDNATVKTVEFSPLGVQSADNLDNISPGDMRRSGI